MFLRLSGFGSNGVIHDTVGEALASGTFTDALNVRFTGVELQKMLEPAPFSVTRTVDSSWMQSWGDGLTTYLAVADGNNIWLYYDNGIDDPSWIDASRDNGYNTDGYWDSTAWGDTCIFNNGIDPPQIYNANTAKFEDLPNWGMLSSADDILNNNPPSVKVQASCVRLVSYKSYLVAVGVTESGLYQPNKVWWSDTTNLAGYAGAPNWDYETPASLSGQIVVNPEGGAIRTAAVLNEQLIIYTDVGATAMQEVGGALVMQFRRLFNKGAAGLHCVAEFNNQHFCISQDQMYLTDGSSVSLFAKDRVEEEFFKRIGKGGRFGNGEVDWDGLQVVKDADRKEIVVCYNRPVKGMGNTDPSVCVPVTITVQPQDGNQGDPGETVTFAVIADGTAPISYQWFENQIPMAGETNATLVVPDTSTSSYYAVVTNDCGSAQSDVVTVVPAETCVAVTIFVQPTFSDNGDGTMTATVVAAGTETITYQWEQDNAGDNNFTEMVGETTDSLTVADTAVNQYRVVVTNPCGTETSDPPILPSCVVTVPNSDIQGVSIWDETVESSQIYFFKGVVAVDGDEIIAAVGGRKIIHSVNQGATWHVYEDALPVSPEDPTNPAVWLLPTSWQKVGSRWYAHFREMTSATGTYLNWSYIGYTDDNGQNWTVGSKALNSRYCSDSVIIEGGKAVMTGRPLSTSPFPTNHTEVWKYADDLGTDFTNGLRVQAGDNTNSGAIRKWSDGYTFVRQDSGSKHRIFKVDSGLTSAVSYSTWTSGTTNPAITAINAPAFTASNGNLNSILLWGSGYSGMSGNADLAKFKYSMGVDDPYETVTMPLTMSAQLSFPAWKPEIWLVARATGGAGWSSWNLAYTLEDDPTVMTHPCDVVLPSIQTSSGSNGRSMNVFPSTNGWWIGWYRKASNDSQIEIFKFQFETYTGSCQLP